MPKTCDYCGTIMHESVQAFMLRISMFAEAAPIEISENDLQQDNMAKLEALIDQMQSMTDHEAQECADEVYENYQFTLCPRCREQIHILMKQRFMSN